MRITKSQRVGLFTAADSRGARCTVLELQEYIQTHVAGKGDEWVPGRRSYALENGNLVDMLIDGSLLVVRTGAKLHKVS